MDLTTNEYQKKVLRIIRDTGSMAKAARELGISRQRVWQIVYLDRQRANDAVKQAIEQGRLIRPAQCDKCHKTTKTAAHHKDYSKRYEIDWLCSKCHTAADRIARPKYKQELSLRLGLTND